MLDIDRESATSAMDSRHTTPSPPHSPRSIVGVSTDDEDETGYETGDSLSDVESVAFTQEHAYSLTSHFVWHIFRRHIDILHRNVAHPHDVRTCTLTLTSHDEITRDDATYLSHFALDFAVFLCGDENPPYVTNISAERGYNLIQLNFSLPRVWPERDAYRYENPNPNHVHIDVTS